MNPYRNEVTFMNENLVETKKIAIDNLTVEITRKCQLQCAHCMKEQIISVVTDLMIEKRGIEWQIPVVYHIGINIH